MQNCHTQLFDVEPIVKTDFGKRLAQIRKSYLEDGGILLSAEEIDKEVCLRRCGLPDGTSAQDN